LATAIASRAALDGEDHEIGGDVQCCVREPESKIVHTLSVERLVQKYATGIHIRAEPTTVHKPYTIRMPIMTLQS